MAFLSVNITFVELYKVKNTSKRGEISPPPIITLKLKTITSENIFIIKAYRKIPAELTLDKQKIQKKRKEEKENRFLVSIQSGAVLFLLHLDLSISKNSLEIF